MTYSMTGFGSAMGTYRDYAIEVQVKTINYRGLDIHVSIPELDGSVELLFNRLIKQYVARGRVDVSVNIKRVGRRASGLNEKLLEQRVAAVEKVMNGEWSHERCMGFVLSQNEIWRADEDERLDQEVIEQILEITHKALEQLASSRRREGKVLKEYLLNAIDELDTSRQSAIQRAPERVTEFRQRLTERLMTLTAEFERPIDERLLASESALLADKIDVTEELTRIGAHLSALRILLLSESDPLTSVGKKIDFYLQELGREATTTASKSRDTILTRHTIDMRTKIESMREQAANIQ